jgi:hypothetical protein
LLGRYELLQLQLHPPFFSNTWTGLKYRHYMCLGTLIAPIERLKTAELTNYLQMSPSCCYYCLFPQSDKTKQMHI